jgi:hypothetical protein
MVESVSTSTEAFETRHPPSRRLRFSLRALFVVVTFIAILLGWKAARYRAAYEIVHRNKAIGDLIAKNVGECPVDCVWIYGPPLWPVFVTFNGSPGSLSLPPEFLSPQIIAAGRIDWLSEYRTALDVSKLMPNARIEQIIQQTCHHYERGLAEAGFQKNFLIANGDAEHVWELSDHGVWVIIEGSQDPTRQQAVDVVVRFLHNEPLQVW